MFFYVGPADNPYITTGDKLRRISTDKKTEGIVMTINFEILLCNVFITKELGRWSDDVLVI